MRILFLAALMRPIPSNSWSQSNETAATKRLSAMSGLRNVLVHDYLDVDLRIVWRLLKKDLADLETFIAAILRIV